MEPALKQRLIGASVLVALAVIFLPMLIKGPAPESGVADVPLDLPAGPRGEYETRELPLIAPGAAPNGGALGMQGREAQPPDVLPTVDAGAADDAAMMPPPTAGGDYAVSFGSYASANDAQRVVAALRASQLPGYQDTVAGSDGRTLYRVRIGPYAGRADAEAARLRAAHVRDDVGSQVVVLDAGPASETAPGQPPADDAAAPASSVAAAGSAQPSRPAEAEPAPAVRASDRASAATPAPAAPPAAAPPAAAREPVAPAAAGVGFAVQLGAFSKEADATKLRDRLRASGFNAFVESVRTDKGTLTRVLAGPVAARADAEQMKAQIASRLGMDGLVRSHP